VRPGDAEASALVEEHRRSIEAYYDCSPEMHRGLGRMYVDDERFARNIGQGNDALVAYLRDAMAVYADTRLG